MYSQNEEEKHIVGFFGDKTDGTFIDVGAFDGCAFSNTLRLIELGWSGVLAEPSPGPFHAMFNRHRSNPKLHLVNAAIVPTVTEPIIKLNTTDDAVSTTDEDFRKIWERVGYSPIYISPISVSDFSSLCTKLLGPHDPDFINVDTEGTTFEIAATLASIYHPAVWCVEYVVGCRTYEPEFKHLFQGYKVIYKSGENLVFVRE